MEEMEFEEFKAAMQEFAGPGMPKVVVEFRPGNATWLIRVDATTKNSSEFTGWFIRNGYKIIHASSDSLWSSHALFTHLFHIRFVGEAVAA